MADNTNSSDKNSGNIRQEYNTASSGLNLDGSINQIEKGKLTYALNAAIENFDANSVSYQNELGNEFCLIFPEGYICIGNHFIQERNKHLFFLVNPTTEASEIGYMDNNDCQYIKYTSGNCLNFSVNHPIHKMFHRITDCSIEVFWTDGYNVRRYLDIENIPYKLLTNSKLCEPAYTDELDCNQLKIQPSFSIPQLEVVDIITGGDITAGTVQFGIQYSDASSNPLTSYYSITNPTPIADPRITTPNFNYQVGKSVVLNISNLDVTGQFQYFNLAVITTVNNIPTPELVGTYFIDVESKTITYTGQNQTEIKLTILDIFEKFPYYELADDITAVQDVLIWTGLTTIDRINYQSIASKITLGWESWKIPSTEDYSNELNATNLRGYLRDEIYAFEFVPLLANGKQLDGFHIPGRMLNGNDAFPDVPITNPDFIGEPTDPVLETSPYWKIYNTATLTGTYPEYTNSVIKNYKGRYQYGEFAYWESVEKYDCNVELWGELSEQPIRHHKFPDVLVSPFIESSILYDGATNMVMQKDSVFPIGVKIDVDQIKQLIAQSNLTDFQKKDIKGFKIIRGNRGTNKSIVAKGLIRNVGEYKREEQTFYFPNYPYNDLTEDPFLIKTNNAYKVDAEPWLITNYWIVPSKHTYIDVNTGKEKTITVAVGQTVEIVALSRPIRKSGESEIAPGNYDVWLSVGTGSCQGYTIKWNTPVVRSNLSSVPKTGFVNGAQFSIFGESNIHSYTTVGGSVETVCPSTNNNCACVPNVTLTAPLLQELAVIVPNVSRRSTLNPTAPDQLDAFTKEESKYRMVFNSPETSFGQPFLGNVLKLENVMFGRGKAHFVEVKKNAKYKLLSEEIQIEALDSSRRIGEITSPLNAVAMFTAYQAYLTIYTNGITRKNYAYSYNSIANYDYTASIPNNLGIKQRPLELKQYLIPYTQSVGDDDSININNYQRESSVFLKTEESIIPLPFAQDSINVPTDVVDKSRMTISSSDACSTPSKEQDISVLSYYASLKNIFINQWGQIYSYETVDTGFQVDLTSDTNPNVIFGGDTFITRYAFKTKLPFFFDNRVNAPDDSDIFYDEIGNVSYPKYWHSARSILKNYILKGRNLSNIISYKAHNFDCPNDVTILENNPNDTTTTTSTSTTINPDGPSGQVLSSANRTYYDGYFYLFAYGVPNFYCESSYNIDLRQAFNNKEGDFWPHVTTGIPDDWVQESFVSIANDNTYTYNITYSKQNKENTFTHLPPDWSKECYTKYPFRSIYSDQQDTSADAKVNSWLLYRPTSRFDFPQNYGPLTSLDGIQNKALLARFENKSLMYNNLLTVNTSNPQAAYFGNPNLFKGAPPIDFAETDLGYIGSQHKFMLKIPEGQITIDAKRGQIFLISGTQAVDLTAFGSGMNRFFTNHLSFEILNYFPRVPIDNHFNNIGLHGVYDTKFNRVIITKLDYIPLDNTIKYDDLLNQFYVENIINNLTIKTQVYLTDAEYFCNKSWTVSFNMNTRSWTSFHSYLPNWYIGENNFFYSGINDCCTDFDVDLQVLAGSMRYELTTTTSTAKPIIPTTTSTTTLFIDCELIGSAIITNCALEGIAIITVPATTTTTICQRPQNMNTYFFVSGYELPSLPQVTTSNSLEDACMGISIVKVAIPNITLTNFSVNAISLSVGSDLYYNADNSDCSFVTDGWYYTEEGLYNDFVYNVQGGQIISIDKCGCETTTTTTTNSINVSECCNAIFNIEDLLYLYNQDDSLLLLPIPGFMTAIGLAMTSNYLWSTDGVTIQQWDINLSPFSATYNKVIDFPTAFVYGKGMSAKNDDKLLIVDATNNPQVIKEVDITTPIATVTSTVITLPVNRINVSNILYTSTGKIIVAGYDNVTLNNYITQLDVLTNVIELDMNIGAVSLPIIYECDCDIFFNTGTGVTYLINDQSPYALTEMQTSTDIINSATQIMNCVTDVIYTTTTTTTATPITTSTTTTIS